MSTAVRAPVLVAEDEEFTLSLLREVLTAAKFQVAAVTNVAGAIDEIGSFDLHVVITDLHFGVTWPSGADLLHHIKKGTPLDWQSRLNLTLLLRTGSSK